MAANQKYQEQLQIFRILKEQRDMFQGQLEILNVSRQNIVNTKNTIENIKEQAIVEYNEADEWCLENPSKCKG